MPEVLAVRITTSDCKEGEAYTHRLPVDADKIDIIVAIETLYGNAGVSEISLSIEDDGEGDDP